MQQPCRECIPGVLQTGGCQSPIRSTCPGRDLLPRIAEMHLVYVYQISQMERNTRPAIKKEYEDRMLRCIVDEYRNKGTIDSKVLFLSVDRDGRIEINYILVDNILRDGKPNLRDWIRVQNRVESGIHSEKFKDKVIHSILHVEEPSVDSTYIYFTTDVGPCLLDMVYRKLRLEAEPSVVLPGGRIRFGEPRLFEV